METNFERIKNGTEEDMVDEFEKVIRWARNLTHKEWYAITNDVHGGLRHFIRETLAHPAK